MREVVLVVSAVWVAACATTPRSPDEEDDPVQLESTITSSSVRIERGRRGPATAVIDRKSEVGEVLRVVDLLAQRGARRVRLKVEDGAEAVVMTQRPDGPDPWLVVTVSEQGFKVFVAAAAELHRPASLQAQAGGSEVPLREGRPDFERLNQVSRALTAKLGKLGGAAVAAPARLPAEVAVAALQQLKYAVPDAQRRTLLPL